MWDNERQRTHEKESQKRQRAHEKESQERAYAYLRCQKLGTHQACAPLK